MSSDTVNGKAVRPFRFILSGCSGGGKSTMIEELAARGLPTYEEPGRKIVRKQIAVGGHALPWVDAEAFAEHAIHRSIEYYDEASQTDGPVFYDRSLIDAMAFLEHVRGLSISDTEMLLRYRYANPVFLVPPWREIYAKDDERQGEFEDAVAEYERLLRFYPCHGYRVVIVPKLPIPERIEFLLNEVAESMRVARNSDAD